MRNPIKLITRKIRTDMALKYIPSHGVHIDIGCGLEKYLLKRSPCREKTGFDKELGDYIIDRIPIDNADCITMLAVIEHLEYPDKIIKECYRILSKDGILIVTTPKKSAEAIIRMYAGKNKKQMGNEHKQYFSLENFQKIVNGYFKIVEYKLFELGFNQIFVCRKITG
jgi:SAM-dependent methyltransferase